MTQEEMLARIDELEAENAHLRGVRKYKVSLVHRFSYEYPWARLTWDGMTTLSKLIRQVCFEKQARPRKYNGYSKKMDCDYLMKTEDMNDEQREKFVEIANEILSVLDQYEVVTEEHRKKHEQDSTDR